MDRLTTWIKSGPLTALSMLYAALVYALMSFGAIENSGDNAIRFGIAGFLLMFAAVTAVIWIYYLKPAQRDDWRGLLPKHVVKVTTASILTILWVCFELWARTRESTYGPPASLVHAAVAGFFWAWGLQDVMRFETRRVDLRTGDVELRGVRTGQGRRKDDGTDGAGR